MATLKLFRCTRPSCTTKDMGRFQSLGWECPQCGLSIKDPKLGHKIIRLTVIHFDPPSEWPGVGLNVRACNKAMPIQAPEGPNGVPNPWHAGTGDPRQVSCPDCLLTDEYKKALLTSEDEEENGQVTASADDDKAVIDSRSRAALDRLESFRI